jgi:sterol desaturase/sphingolipid hydroxylase (fatty acid hydroxylase superfamily)
MHLFTYFVCRYDFPWSVTKLIPFYGGPEYHDYHHYVGGQSQSNFASVFTYCDYIYGTDKVSFDQTSIILLCPLAF